ncbi:MAG: exosortase/archaeosortase family protein [Nitrospirota bacterium]
MKNSLISTYIQLMVLVLSFLLLFNYTLIELFKDWSTNPNYSHGFLVPCITAFMIWQKREKLCLSSLSPSNWGLLILIMGMIVHVVANLGAELFTMRIAMVITIFGFSIYFMGGKITRNIAVPLGYLIFMIPIPAVLWNKIAFPLQIFASRMAEIVIRAMGISVLREGNILYLTNTTLEVVDACSGIRSLITLSALSAAFAYLSNHSIPKKWILFTAALPIALLVNIIRLSLTAGLASRFGEKVAQGFIHEFSGLFIYLLGLVLLVSVHGVLSKLRRTLRTL